MTVARHYVMHAKAGMEDGLETALRNLIEAVRPLPGCEGVELMRDIENTARFVFIERWADVAAHKAAGPLLDKALFAPMMAAVEGRPESAYLDYIHVI